MKRRLRVRSPRPWNRRPRAHRIPTARKPLLRYIPGEWVAISLRNGRIQDASSQLLRWLDVSRAALVGSPWTALTPSESAEGRPITDDMLRDPGRYEEVAVCSAEGETRQCDMWVTHVGRSWALCVFIDRSQQKQLQDALIAKHRELRKAYDALAERTTELEEARNELRAKAQEISRLSSQAMTTNAVSTIGEITAELTHQVNNPLAAAIGAYRSIKRAFERNDAANMDRMIQLLGTALTRIHNTVDEIHELYKHFQLPHTPIAPVVLQDRVRAVLTLLEQQLEPVRVHVDIPEEFPPVAARANQFEHVLINLIDNAAAAARDPKTICISATRTEDDKAEIRIEDNGRGIPSHLHEKVFEAFYSTKQRGSGLGLAAVRRYVRQDGATVHIDTSPLGGAAFVLRYALYGERL